MAKCMVNRLLVTTTTAVVLLYYGLTSMPVYNSLKEGEKSTNQGLVNAQSLTTSDETSEDQDSDKPTLPSDVDQVEQVDQTTLRTDVTNPTVTEFIHKSESVFPLTTNKNSAIQHPLPNWRAAELLRQNVLSSSKLSEHIESVRPILVPHVYRMIGDFISWKMSHGSAIERNFYLGVTVESFITRIFRKRCAVFFLDEDVWTLPDGKYGRGGFEVVGTDDEEVPLVLENVLSYDEMLISALMGLSSYTMFFNDGSRHNNGVPGEIGTFIPEGVIVGLVGPRFEKEFVMEHSLMVVTQTQNTETNGYGKNAAQTDKGKSLGFFARYFGHDRELPTFDEVRQAMTAAGVEDTKEFVYDNEDFYYSRSKNAYLNLSMYKQRIKISAQTLLLEAADRAKQAGMPAYVHVVGLGTGVWGFNPNSKEDSAFQADKYIEAFQEVVMSLPEEVAQHIGVVDKSWVIERAQTPPSHVYENGIAMRYSKRNPQAVIKEAVRMVLVVSYAWDSNSWPGNEFYLGKGYLSASGDPAAAACCSISELHNPFINDKFVNGDRSKVFFEANCAAQGGKKQQEESQVPISRNRQG
eukprot:GHVQ01000901.1.p1 GENE.GHVQ01000901.1~~GHVQ01000901.1.p1  ORF type:complete len:579 (-),score=79.68 GHVQ01000901.1:1508-3244(-)